MSGTTVGEDSMQILVLNDNSAHRNWGAQATPHALFKVLRQASPSAEISAIPHAWFRTKYRAIQFPFGKELKYRVGAIPHINPALAKISKPIEYFPQVADDFDYFLEEWGAGQGGPPADEFLELAQRADVIVYNGENSNYRNTVEACRASFLLWVAKKALEKPACAVNLTVHLNTVRPILNGMVELVYPTLDLVATREPCSHRNLLDHGVKNAVSSSDVVFGLDPADYPRDGFERWRHAAGLHKPYFCLSASGLPASAPRGDWDGEVVRLVRELKKIVPNGVMVAKDGSHRFMREVALRTDSVFFGPEHEFHELWPLFERAEFLVSGHFHYVIFGAMVGCPFVPLSANNHKMQGLCEQLEWPRVKPFDITRLSSCQTEIGDSVRDLLLRGNELGVTLRSKSSDLRKEVESIAQQVVTLGMGPADPSVNIMISGRS